MMTPNSPTTTLLCAILRSVKALSRNWHTAHSLCTHCFSQKGFPCTLLSVGHFLFIKNSLGKNKSNYCWQSTKGRQICVHTCMHLSISDSNNSVTFYIPPSLSLSHTHTHIYYIWKSNHTYISRIAKLQFATISFNLWEGHRPIK